MNTKKLLVAYDERKPASGKTDFLIVLVVNAAPFFLGLKTGRNHQTGKVVFIGKEISPQDLFAKLVESGRKIENVDKTLQGIAAYVQQIQNFKIGNIVSLSVGSDEAGFELVKTAEMPKVEAGKLP